VAAVAEYSPVTLASGDPMTKVVTRNVDNYVLNIRQAAKQKSCKLEA